MHSNLASAAAWTESLERGAENRFPLPYPATITLNPPPRSCIHPTRQHLANAESSCHSYPVPVSDPCLVGGSISSILSTWRAQSHGSNPAPGLQQSTARTTWAQPPLPFLFNFALPFFDRSSFFLPAFCAFTEFLLLVGGLSALSLPVVRYNLASWCWIVFFAFIIRFSPWHCDFGGHSSQHHQRPLLILE